MAPLIIAKCDCCRRFRAYLCRTGGCRPTSTAKSPGAARPYRSALHPAHGLASSLRPPLVACPGTATGGCLCSHTSPPGRVRPAVLRVVLRTEHGEPTGLWCRCRNKFRRRPRSSRMHYRQESRARRRAEVAAACSRCDLPPATCRPANPDRLRTKEETVTGEAN